MCLTYLASGLALMGLLTLIFLPAVVYVLVPVVLAVVVFSRQRPLTLATGVLTVGMVFALRLAYSFVVFPLVEKGLFGYPDVPSPSLLGLARSAGGGVVAVLALALFDAPLREEIRQRVMPGGVVNPAAAVVAAASVGVACLWGVMLVQSLGGPWSIAVQHSYDSGGSGGSSSDGYDACVAEKQAEFEATALAQGKGSAASVIAEGQARTVCSYQYGGHG